MHTTAIESYKKKLTLSESQREVLIGILLGDAHLESQNKGKTYRLKIEQSLKHREYVTHLHDHFHEWVRSEPRMKKISRYGTISYNVAFATLSHAAFRFYANQFYDGRKKKVPDLIHRWLTPKALAYWFMDDGSMKSSQSKGVILNTQGFSRSEVERLKELLVHQYELKVSLRSQREGWQLYFSGESYERLDSLIRPHFIPAMLYKWPQPRNRRPTQLPKL